MTADEAFAVWYEALPEPRPNKSVAKAAWDAAAAWAAQTARESTKRYCCKKMRGVCTGIADQIKRA